MSGREERLGCGVRSDSKRDREGRRVRVETTTHPPSHAPIFCRHVIEEYEVDRKYPNA